jgi:hypothetical protein
MILGCSHFKIFEHMERTLPSDYGYLSKINRVLVIKMSMGIE